MRRSLIVLALAGLLAGGCYDELGYPELVYAGSTASGDALYYGHDHYWLNTNGSWYWWSYYDGSWRYAPYGYSGDLYYRYYGPYYGRGYYYPYGYGPYYGAYYHLNHYHGYYGPPGNYHYHSGHHHH